MPYTKRIDRIDHAIHELSIHLLMEHPNIIPIIDYKIDLKGGDIIMPIAESNLLNLITYKPRLNSLVVDKYIDYIGKAIDYIHSVGITHRDIKLDNILIKDGLPYLTDFGISIHHQDECYYGMCCAPRYRPPEAFNCDEIVKPLAIDMWAYGIVILEILMWKTNLFVSPLGELMLTASYKNGIEYVSSKYTIDPKYVKLLIGLLDVNPVTRRESYSDDLNIIKPTLYPPTNELIKEIVKELFISSSVFTIPNVNDITTLWLICCCHDVFLDDRYCESKDKTIGKLYNDILNGRKYENVFRLRKSSVNSNSG